MAITSYAKQAQSIKPVVKEDTNLSAKHYIAKMRPAFWLVGAAVPLDCHTPNDHDLILAKLVNTARSVIG